MIGQLRKIGKILHISNLARNILVIKLYERTRVGVVIYDKEMRELGKIIEVFGPVKAPYARVLLKEGVGVSINELRGTTCYIIEGEEERVKWRKMPRPRKGRVE